MKDFENIACPLCKSTEYEQISTRGHRNIPLHVSICRNCGLAYLNPRWSKKRYDYFHKHEYDSHYRQSIFSQKDDKILYRKTKDIMNRLKEHKLLPKNPKAILDIGSGMGWSLIYLKKHHYPEAKLFAIEPSKHCLDNLSKMRINIVADDVNNMWESKNSNKFDFIIMRHVLEHLLDPVAILKKVSKALTSGGILYIAVPNAMNPDLPLAKSHFRATHTCYFSKDSLLSAIQAAGLKSLQISEYNEKNQHELYVVAEKANSFAMPKANHELYRRQKETYTRQLKKEKHIHYMLLWSIMRKASAATPLLKRIGVYDNLTRIKKKLLH